MSDAASPPPRGPYACTASTCDATETIMGYAPSFGASIAFTILFFLTTIVHAYQGYRYRAQKQWWFAGVMVVGAFCEGLGYVGRILLAPYPQGDPFSEHAFKLQIVLLTFAPAFLAAGIYLQLKHLVLTFGTSSSRLRPQWYTYLFISCDVLSIVLQGAGGGLASAARGPGVLMDAGNGVMMAGLSFQVFTLVGFGVLASEYFLRVKKAGKAGGNAATAELRASGKFKGFLAAITIAYFAILVRCVYRIVEMSSGWGSEIMRDEVAYIVLDPCLIVIACIVLNAFHPGRCYSSTTTHAAGIETPADAEKGYSTEDSTAPSAA